VPYRPLNGRGTRSLSPLGLAPKTHLGKGYQASAAPLAYGDMEHFNGSLRLAGDIARVHVGIDLTEEHELRISTENVEIGHWEIGALAVRAADDGFHMLADGEELILTTDDDPAFAIAMGIRNAPPVLRKQISDRLRYDPQYHHVDDPIQSSGER
jgi:hypothetical protein